MHANVLILVGLILLINKKYVDFIQNFQMRVDIYVPFPSNALSAACILASKHKKVYINENSEKEKEASNPMHDVHTFLARMVVTLFSSCFSSSCSSSMVHEFRPSPSSFLERS